jgi:hypothetical protein
MYEVYKGGNKMAKIVKYEDKKQYPISGRLNKRLNDKFNRLKKANKLNTSDMLAKLIIDSKEEK